jgi:hypothetical protein
MNLLLLLVLVITGATISATTLGTKATAVGIGVCGLAVLPRMLVTLTGASISSTTMAPARIGLYTNNVALLLGTVVVGTSAVLGRIPRGLALVPVACLVVAVSQNDLPVWVVSGIVQWCLLALAWGFGAEVARLVKSGGLGERAYVTILFIPVLAHASMSLMQFAGFGYVNVVSAGSETISRVTGFAGHPGNLGKILILILIMLLPFTKSADRYANRASVAAVLVICLTLGLTFSRANVAAVIVLLGIWYVLGPGATTLKRFAVPVIGGLAALPVIDVLLTRQAYDSDGGSRPELQSAALEQIHRTLLFGVGPNDYLPTVGRFDAQAASGLPVHNTLLLMLAELGLIITPIVVWLLVRIVRDSRTHRRLRNLGGLQSAAVLAATPGMFVILWTGHGMVSSPLGLLAFFTAGYVHHLTSTAGSQQTSVPAGSRDAAAGIGSDARPTHGAVELAVRGAEGRPSALAQRRPHGQLPPPGVGGAPSRLGGGRHAAGTDWQTVNDSAGVT